MKASYRQVTLREAEQLLEGQERNRPLRSAWVNRLAAMMEDGDWYAETGETIKISSAGKLLDGQHRLEAMRVYGKPVKFLVVDGIQPEAQEFMDNNRTRSAADDLAMHGYSHANQLAAMARILMFHESGILSSGGATIWKGKRITRVYSPKTVRTFVDSRPRLLESIRESGRLCSRSQQLFAVTYVAVLREIFVDLDAERAEWFLGRLADGVGLDRMHPVYLLRRIMLREKLERGKSYSWVQRYAFAFKAWNLYAQGFKRRQLAVRSSEAWPEPIVPKKEVAHE